MIPMTNKFSTVLSIAVLLLVTACGGTKENDEQTNESDMDKGFSGKAGEVKIMTLDPGHFHAALVQKFMLDQVDKTVYVYGPEGPDLEGHLKRIEGFNTRADNPTSWEEVVYRGDDFFEKMMTEKPGNVVVISGNNAKKASYISQLIGAGINVLADKPMIIRPDEFEILKKAFETAAGNGAMLYDIMTERYEITTMLQKELALNLEVFGELQAGTPEQPAVTKESVHHFFKYVSGSPLQRPPWFMDIEAQGEGIVDVSTHLVDLIQWACFPEQIIDYTKDIEMVKAKRWATEMTPSQFKGITKLDTYPDYMQKYVTDSILNVYSNGEFVYKLKGIHAKVSVIWNYEAPEGAKDTHFSIMRGSKANVVIRQGAEQNYQATLYVENILGKENSDFEQKLKAAIETLSVKYPGIGLENTKLGWKVVVPDSYNVGHEAHFSQVTEKYLEYLAAGKMPDWEVPNMIAKYYTNMEAYKMAHGN